MKKRVICDRLVPVHSDINQLQQPRGLVEIAGDSELGCGGASSGCGLVLE
ncbi:MAG: hypothetical protein WCD53_16675 [Microcoleus sp.]